MMVFVRFLLLIFTVLSLSGCISYISTDIETFNELPSTISGKSYQIQVNPQQENSLEFRSYVNRIKAILQNVGMTEQKNGNADYLVSVLYGIDNGRIFNSSHPIYGEVGLQSAFRRTYQKKDGKVVSYTEYMPRYGVIGTENASQLLFTSWLRIDISQPGEEGKFNKVFEGKAVSLNSNNQLPNIMPYLIRSLFEGFPAQRAVSRTVTLPVQGE